MRYSILCFCVLIYGTVSMAAANPLQDTRNRLNHLQQKINRLSGDLKSKQQKNRVLTQELAYSEKKIGVLAVQLKNTETRLENSANALAQQKKKIEALLEKQAQQQAYLAQHLRSRYKVDNLQALKSLLNQDKTSDYTRLLVYYRYIINARKTLIFNLHETKKSLIAEKKSYQMQYRKQRQIKDKLLLEQKKLAAERAYQREIVQQIQNDIQQNQNKLTEYQQNQKNLQQVLKKLESQYRHRHQRPFSEMRHRLPHPLIHGIGKKIKGLHGVTIPGTEGEPVKAIYSGKVVFSDWLKGYGLLLILDHGQGYMTLYAHNLALLKQTGDEVMQGEAIAKVGHSGGLRENGLYFEIRYRGKAIAAADWLR